MTLQLDSFDVKAFLSSAGIGKSVVSFSKGDSIFAQGNGCAHLFYIQAGSLKLTLVSKLGKEATIALLNAGDFAGEECLATQQAYRTASATALTKCVLVRITRAEMLKVLHDEPIMSGMFVAYLLARTNRIQADLVDQLFNSSEKRLARMLLLLANFGKDGENETLIPAISQETLAAMIGCSRPRVNQFLNRFRKLGYIEYDDRIRVKKALLQVVLHD